MSERPTQPTGDKSRELNSREATPQEVGDALTARLKQHENADLPEPGFLERMTSRPEGVMLLLLILAVGAGVISSQPVQELLRRLVQSP